MTRRQASLRQSRAQLVAAHVEDEILEARLPVGAHLGRRSEFMERFGISPTIMNETLRILRDRGLVGARPGAGGGIFVASLPPQVRLGAMDLWFYDSGTHPLDLFEARLHLEDSLTAVAFERADDRDIDAMVEAVSRLGRAAEARSYLEGLFHLHRIIVSAARVKVLDGMHQSIIAMLLGGLSRASYIDGYEPLLKQSLAVHHDLVESIRTHDRTLFSAATRRHHETIIRVDDPRRSPTADEEAESA